MTATSVPADPSFAAVEAQSFTRELLAGLASGTLAAVRIPSFIDPAGCEATVKALDGLVPSGDGPAALARFGPALMDYRLADNVLDTSRYLDDAEACASQWDQVKPDPDPVAVALAAFAAAWGAPVAPATVQGRPVAGMTMREINGGALAHDDDVTRELAPGTFDQKVTAQLAFNIFVSAPEEGGAVQLWKRRWQQGDEEYVHSYGYRPEAVEGCQHATFVPRPGEAVLFNAGHFHGIEKVGAGRRITVSFFVGITDAGQLVSWA